MRIVGSQAEDDGRFDFRVVEIDQAGTKDEADQDLAEETHHWAILLIVLSGLLLLWVRYHNSAGFGLSTILFSMPRLDTRRDLSCLTLHPIFRPDWSGRSPSTIAMMTTR